MNETSDYKILLVDDEPDILEFIGYNLKKEGFSVRTANNGQDGLKIAKEENPHLIVLDVMMPGMDGIETCEEIRKVPALKDTLVVFLTARGEDYSQIAGFDAGADDYITKPIKPKVLISRVKALLKRYAHGTSSKEPEEDNKITVGDLIIDREKYLVTSGSKELSLPKKEFELLLLLAAKPDRVFTRDEIYASVWGDNIIVGDRTIDVHIRKLREKIGQDHIRTIKGVGYKFVD
ncbi:response regulator transcription factor [Marinilabilia salmonicolor]|jgi:two-component system alkaline phosphatase synthesis response regulator PhoP|uniref:Phosphate regulon transcriptional regulatory protein PhoB n=1 Tax=Marinilabilia salmonicolor TaxID=989 RepID=A0A2T0XR71_9BACT|nr:response regulator transcription factor [Marinilabilia salmonicolor]PRZ01423.1 two-component system alkaline phosphatase synthesis response regulator PhoP [Marinilabilia salmonicolor]RCW29563.1 two-component system alkaline phosphatase synthesis response regulator PhoP [Marinilabilia salmonicolor]